MNENSAIGQYDKTSLETDKRCENFTYYFLWRLVVCRADVTSAVMQQSTGQELTNSIDDHHVNHAGSSQVETPYVLMYALVALTWR